MTVPKHSYVPTLGTIVRALRPEHWIKNSLVLAAFVFAMGDPLQAPKLQPLGLAFLKTIAACLLFCAISSGVYIMNDIRDLSLDREHPLKKHRPIASGALSVAFAAVLASVLLSIGLVCSYFLSLNLLYVTGGYLVLQIAYTVFLKKIALVDVCVIAVGFVLRALAGAAVLALSISPWLILCTFMLALFLGFCKRRHEKVISVDNEAENRPSLTGYNERLLDQAIAIVASATIVSYALYTLSPETVHKFGSAALGFTIPFVVFGILRYLDLVYRHEKGNRPERILLTDIPILIDILLYGLVILAIFMLGR